MQKTSWPHIAALAAAIAVAPGGAGAATYADRVVEKTFGNGLKALVLEDHKAPVGVVQVWYRVGSRNETLGSTGLSHLLEHMMFKGTKKVGPEEYSRIIQINGGNENAFTSQDYTTYFATLASDRLTVEVDLEADRMVNLALTPDLFAPERAVVEEERRLRSVDSPTTALFELISATAYTAHPYQWPVIGWMNDLKKATHEDIEAHYRAYYNPSNAFVVVVGDVSAETFLPVLEAAFGALPSRDGAPGVRSVEPEQRGERRVQLKREAELPMVGIAYHVPNITHPDGAVLDVLARVLAGGKSARLYNELVYKRRIALEVGAWYDAKSKDPGLFTFYGQPLPGKDVAAVEAALLDQIEALKTKEIPPRELEKAVNGIEAEFTFAQDSAFYQGLLLGQYEVIGDWRLIDQYLPAVRAVSAGDLQRAARTYLGADTRTVGVLVPLPRTGPPSSAPPVSAGGGMVH